MSSLGKNIPHDSAATHVSGESLFIDDITPMRGELLVDFLGSPFAHAKLIAIDIADALKIPGVVAIYTHKDVPGHLHFGPVVKDEHLLVNDEARFVGDPIVLIAAQTRAAILAAKRAIKLTMHELPPIFSIDEAIEHESFLGAQRVIERGDLAGAFASAPHTLSGTFTIGGQEHFYLESQAAIAYPGENGAMIVHSSTQHPTEVQSIIAEVLGVPFNHVVVVCKRMGGGFGGKETQAAGPAAMAAMVAAKLHRPARFFISKDDDMRTTGKRHPFKGFYKVAFDDAGVISGYEIDLFSDGGCTSDLSYSILERAMLHAENAYFIPSIRITGRVCKTNLPSNTAFRGFGGPQGVACIENAIEQIARHLSVDSIDIRRRNIYGIHERNTAPCGQIIRNNMLPRLFDELPRDCDYTKRRSEIDRFNAASRTQLRGMSLTPVKFGISFTKKTLNQANALVNIYTDGTVMVSTGGTEMGQGVYTRVRQIVAHELGIDYGSVIVAPTSTDKNHNTSPTAASSGTDLNGAAARDACVKLRERLATYAATQLCTGEGGLNGSPANIVFADGFVYDDRAPSRRLPFGELICRAYVDRVNLGERGFYITPGVDFNRDTGQGHPFLYFTNGAACSEVLIDRLTGEMRVVRVDLLMDAGVSINPGIDRGQIVGGFIQGMGWVTSEELKWSPKGVLWSYSPTTYKIPNISDLPETFNVALLDNPDSTMSLYHSKALGEPPLLLGISVWTAVKNALAYASDEASKNLALPATPEQILMSLHRASDASKSSSTRRATSQPA